jgi:hypothetical protein
MLNQGNGMQIYRHYQGGQHKHGWTSKVHLQRKEKKAEVRIEHTT